MVRIAASLCWVRQGSFGLPVVEAVEWGKKVLASPLEVYREFGVPEDSMVDFADAEAVWRAMQEPGPTQLSKAPMTWEECARSHLAILRQTARQPEPSAPVG